MYINKNNIDLIPFKKLIVTDRVKNITENTYFILSTELSGDMFYLSWSSIPETWPTPQIDDTIDLEAMLNALKDENISDFLLGKIFQHDEYGNIIYLSKTGIDDMYFNIEFPFMTYIKDDKNPRRFIKTVIGT